MFIGHLALSFSGEGRQCPKKSENQENVFSVPVEMPKKGKDDTSLSIFHIYDPANVVKNNRNFKL